VAGGRSGETGVAIVERASMPDQRVVRCRLHELGAVAEDQQVTNPAVVIIGDVVRV
jgi:siroheme synthase